MARRCSPWLANIYAALSLTVGTPAPWDVSDVIPACAYLCGSQLVATDAGLVDDALQETTRDRVRSDT